MEAIFLKLVNMSLTASWLVLAVLILRLALKKAPRWMLCALWGLVALRLVCPFSVESALSLIPSSEPLPQEIIYTAEPEINSGVPAIDQMVNPVLSETLTADGLTSANLTQIWSFILSHVWLVGMLAMLLYALGSFLLLKRRMATATLLRENIKQSELADSPFVLGIFRPIIYLPYAISEPDMAYVIAHEQAHIRRKDHWWKPLGFLLLSVYWFNPVLWLAYVLLCRDIEAACDERVIADMEKDDRRAYSTALLNCSVHRRRIAACPLAFGEVGVKDRVKSVMNYKKPAFWIIVVAVVASIVVAVCFLTDPAEDSTPDRVEDGYYLLIGADGVKEIRITKPSSNGGVVNADGSFFEKGEEVWLEPLDGVTDLRGVSITALGEDGEVLYVLSFPEGASEEEIINIVGGDGWLLAPTNFESSVLRSADAGTSSQTVSWTYSPMMSATWHAAFHFNFELDYSHIEASCDYGTLWDFGAGGQPRAKELRFEAGQSVCWNPGTDGETLTDTAETAVVSFTVYNGGEVLYAGTLDIVRTGTENGKSFYEAKLVGTDLLALRQENGNMGAAVITTDTYREMVSQATVIYEDADLDHDGQNDRIHVREVHPGQLYELSVSRQDGTLLWSTQAGYPHTGWNTILLCREGGKDYLVQYNPTMFQGVGSYGWTRFSLEGSRPLQIDSMYVDFELPLQMDDSLRAFAEQTDRLLEDCTVLLSTEQFTPVIGPCEATDLPQIYPVRFDPDEIQAAIDGTAESWEHGPNAASLPETPLEFLFASGAGGWGTTLTLQPDGSFTGNYSDTDMGSGIYICEFGGQFTEIRQISDYAWSMKLKSVVSSSEEGETWIEDGVRYIASDPHGITGGEEFILYSPGIPADELPADFRDWWPDAYHWRNGELEHLEGWGLYNANTGHGFFTAWLT